MIRLLARLVLALLANALGLLVAAWLVSGFSIDVTSFIAAVLIFSVVEVLAGPLLLKLSLRNVPALAGGIALVTTLVGLIFTDVLSDGLTITGLSAWVLATLVVWLSALLAGLLLPLFLFKKALNKHQAATT